MRHTEYMRFAPLDQRVYNMWSGLWELPASHWLEPRVLMIHIGFQDPLAVQCGVSEEAAP